MSTKHICCTDLADFERVQAQIHQWHIDNIPGYNAERWLTTPIELDAETRFVLTVDSEIAGEIDSALLARLRDPGETNASGAGSGEGKGK